jgi:hypothetical protein
MTLLIAFTTAFGHIEVELRRTSLTAFASASVFIEFPVRSLTLGVALAHTSVQVKIESGFASFVAFTRACMRIQIEIIRAFPCAYWRTGMRVNCVSILSDFITFAHASVRVKVESRLALFVAFTLTSMSIKVKVVRTFSSANWRATVRINGISILGNLVTFAHTGSEI